MKTIFRYMNVGLLAAVFFAFGAVASFAQSACEDVETKNTLDKAFRDNYAGNLDARKKAVDAGKEYIQKFGECPDSADFVQYLKNYLPTMESKIKTDEELIKKNALIKRFDDSLKAKNWDESYASGKEILAKYPDEFRTVEIVLASIGGEEAFKANNKYNDEAIRFAKQSIADLESGKAFVVGGKPRFGLSLKEGGKVVYNFEYPNKEDALGWLNLYIGYITAVAQKNTPAALPYLFKATQTTASEASKNSVSYDLIGTYYIGELNKIYDAITALRAQQDKEGITEEELKTLVADIKAKVAMANGTSERAMDAFARAFTLAKDPAIKTRTRKTLEELYRRRFDKTEGVDAWVATAVNKPFVNPQTPIAPVSDEPATTTTSTTTSPAASSTTAPTTAKPAATAPAAKPAAQPGAKANGAKLQTKVTKPVKRKVA